MATETSRLRPFIAATASFKDGSNTPRDFLEGCLEVIDAVEPGLQAFVELNIGAAREAADAATRRWKAGSPLSLIDGMPVGIKDIIETADMPTGQGSALFPGWRGGRDAASVAALREAGAVIVGKTVTTEFAGTEPGPTRNPWDPERTPGGSSSGSGAAVGAGMLPAALGTQVVGSVLRPASFCGWFGYKPSVGGINRGGSFDYFSQSCTGVLAATLADAWCLARSISSRAGGDPGYPGIGGPLEPPPAARPRRLAFLETAGWQSAGGEARSVMEAALARLRAAGIDVHGRKANATIDEVERAISDAVELTRAINDWEARWPLNTYARDLDSSRLSEPSRERLARAVAMTQEEFRLALERRDRVRASFATLAEEFDACFTLSATGAAPQGLGWTGDPVFVAPASLLGTPSLSLPLLQDAGLPLGLQLVGFRDADAALLAVGAAIEPLIEAA